MSREWLYDNVYTEWDVCVAHKDISNNEKVLQSGVNDNALAPRFFKVCLKPKTIYISAEELRGNLIIYG